MCVRLAYMWLHVPLVSEFTFIYWWEFSIRRVWNAIHIQKSYKYITFFTWCFVWWIHVTYIIMGTSLEPCMFCNIKWKHCISSSQFFSFPLTGGESNLQQSVHNNTDRLEYHQRSPQSSTIVRDILRFEAFWSVFLLNALV